MKTENEQEHMVAEGEPRGEHHQHGHGYNLSQEIDEKLEHVVEEIEQIEELTHEEDREEHHTDHHHHKTYVVDIEGVDYTWNSETITVADIRRLGNLPPDQPVIEVDPCNQERTLTDNEVIHLKPGHRYGKKVRYKRGLQDRMRTEIDLLRRFYPDAEWHPSASAGGWVKIPAYSFPAPIWNRHNDTICFEVPAGYPGQAPYGFYVGAGLRLQESGAIPLAYQEGVATPFAGSWGKFSWSHDGTWKPTGDTSSGSNLANFVLTFADRLREAS
jgi:hypothetical protein